MQDLLDAKAQVLSASVVNHLRFHLRDVFNLAVSERAMDFNPALALHTPKCKPGREKLLMNAAQIRRALAMLSFYKHSDGKVYCDYCNKGSGR